MNNGLAITAPVMEHPVSAAVAETKNATMPRSRPDFDPQVHAVYEAPQIRKRGAHFKLLSRVAARARPMRRVSA